MDDFEPSQQVFRGGEQLDVHDLKTLFADVFDLLLYQKLRLRHSSQYFDGSYSSNEEFWIEAFRKQHFQSMRVQLKGFHLIEWFMVVPKV